MRRLGPAGVILSAAAVLVASPGSAAARPQYSKSFQETYPSLREQAQSQKCGVCHCGPHKRGTLNDDGTSLKKVLAEKNIKDAKRIVDALRTVEKEPSSEPDKTFGDLIDEGKLPGKLPGKCPEKPKNR